MPLSELHTRKRKTNLAILAAVMAWGVLLFVVAMVKMGAGQ